MDVLEHGVHHAAGHLLRLGGDEGLGQLGEAPQDAVGLGQLGGLGRRRRRGTRDRGRALCSRQQDAKGPLKVTDGLDDRAGRIVRHRLPGVEDDPVLERAPDMEYLLPEPDLVATLENGLGHSDAVQVRAALAAEVDQPAPVPLDHHLGLAGGDPPSGEDDATGRGVPEQQHPGGERDHSFAASLLVCQLEHRMRPRQAAVCHYRAASVKREGPRHAVS